MFIYFCIGNENDPNIICYRNWDVEKKKWSEYEEFGFGSGNYAAKGNTSEEEIDSLFELGIYTVQPSWAIYIGESEPRNDVEPTVVLVAKRPSDNVTYQIAFCWGSQSSDGTMDNDEGDYDCILWRSYGSNKKWRDWRQLTSGGSGNITVDDVLNTTSENPVQNKIIKAALDGKANMGVVTSNTINKTYAPGIYQNDQNDGAVTPLGDLKFVIVSKLPDDEMCQIGLIDGDLNGKTTFFFAIRVYNVARGVWTEWLPMYNGMFASTVDDYAAKGEVTQDNIDTLFETGIYYRGNSNTPDDIEWIDPITGRSINYGIFSIIVSGDCQIALTDGGNSDICLLYRQRNGINTWTKWAKVYANKMERIPDHPDIRCVERYGMTREQLSRYESEETDIVGTCLTCGEDVSNGYEYVESRDGVFCCLDCCHDFYNIKHIF